MEDLSVLQMENKLYEALEAFCCFKDKDIENFLRIKAVEFEKRKLCSVYLILDREKLKKDELYVHAYFTLSHKCLGFVSNVSRTTRNRIVADRNAELAHFVLIGQLGKYMRKEDGKIIESTITSGEILDDAFFIINQAKKWIACRNTLIECNANIKIKSLYENYGFSELQFDRDHFQLFKRI